MKHGVLVGVIMLAFPAAYALDAAEVTNVNVSVRGNYVDITYDLAQAQNEPCTILVSLSKDGGLTYAFPAMHVTGDTTNVLPGKDRRIVWNAYADYPGEEIVQAGIRVEAMMNQTVMLPGNVPLVMVVIPAGSFIMGSPDFERPQHQVTLSRGFWMGRYEVTQAQWQAIMGNNPSCFTGDPSRPVDSVSYDDICSQNRFLDRLNQTLPGMNFRLPTEAEWEYACRAGTTTRFSWGDDLSYAQLGSFAWYDLNGGAATHPVGQKEPNRWGLYDMSGNVIEWCQDLFGDYPSTPVTDPSEPASGSYGYRVLRGGSFFHPQNKCRSSAREANPPNNGVNFFGFRLVRTQ